MYHSSTGVLLLHGQFKKNEKHPWRSGTFILVAGFSLKLQAHEMKRNSPLSPIFQKNVPLQPFHLQEKIIKNTTKNRTHKICRLKSLSQSKYFWWSGENKTKILIIWNKEQSFYCSATRCYCLCDTYFGTT